MTGRTLAENTRPNLIGHKLSVGLTGGFGPRGVITGIRVGSVRAGIGIIIHGQATTASFGTAAQPNRAYE